MLCDPNDQPLPLVRRAGLDLLLGAGAASADLRTALAAATMTA